MSPRTGRACLGSEIRSNLRRSATVQRISYVHAKLVTLWLDSIVRAKLSGDSLQTPENTLDKPSRHSHGGIPSLESGSRVGDLDHPWFFGEQASDGVLVEEPEPVQFSHRAVPFLPHSCPQRSFARAILPDDRRELESAISPPGCEGDCTSKLSFVHGVPRKVPGEISRHLVTVTKFLDCRSAMQ